MPVVATTHSEHTAQLLAYRYASEGKCHTVQLWSNGKTFYVFTLATNDYYQQRFYGGANCAMILSLNVIPTIFKYAVIFRFISAVLVQIAELQTERANHRAEESDYHYNANLSRYQITQGMIRRFSALRGIAHNLALLGERMTYAQVKAYRDTVHAKRLAYLDKVFALRDKW